MLRRARAAVAATFALNAMLVATWVPRIPEMKDRLDLSAASLGLALLAPATGALLAMTVVGQACVRFGSARVTRGLAVGYCLVGWLPGLATNLPQLWLLLLLWGVGMGGMDVAMNAQGVTVEQAYRRPVLSSFHAAWSLGSLVGALIGSVGAGAGVPIAAQQAVVAALGAALVLPTTRWFLSDPASDRIAAPRGRSLRERLPRPDARLIMLGVAAVCALLTEGSVADWSGVLLRDTIHVRAGEVGLAYAAFTALMTIGRLVGDRVVQHFGRSRTLVGLGGVGALGSAAGLLSQSLVGLVIGFALLGAGLATMVPIYFSTAADGEASAGPPLAFVSSLGYTGFLVGPTVIGLVAEQTSVLAALWLVPVLTAVGVGLGVVAVRLTAARTPRALTPVE